MPVRAVTGKMVSKGAAGGIGDVWRSIVGAPDEALKPAYVQIYEMLRLRLRCGIGPRYYLSAGLNDRTVPLSDVLGHVSEDGYRRFVRHLNPPENRAPLNSKVEQKRLLLAAGISTPKPFYSAATIDVAAMAEALRPAVGSEVAAKPVASFGGRGFRFLKVILQNDEVALLEPDSGVALSADEFASSMPGGALIEPYVNQHPAYNNLNPSSVNTWRIWVIRQGDYASTILIYLRIGRAGSRVDNLGGGGLFAALCRDGSLKAAQDGSLARRRFANHPDSGSQILGTRLPFIDEAKRLAEQTLMALPALQFAGVDVAVTPAGPIVIEVNPEPDRSGAARVGLPFKTWLREHGVTV